MKVTIQVYFCKVAGENGKELLPEIFLSCQKRISPIAVFKILFQLTFLKQTIKRDNPNTGCPTKMSPFFFDNNF